LKEVRSVCASSSTTWSRRKIRSSGGGGTPVRKPDSSGPVATWRSMHWDHRSGEWKWLGGAHHQFLNIFIITIHVVQLNVRLCPSLSTSWLRWQLQSIYTNAQAFHWISDETLLNHQ